MALDVLFIGDEIDPWAAGGGPRMLLSDDPGGAGELRPGAYRANLPLFGEPACIIDGRWTYVAGPPAGNRNNTDGGVLGLTTIESRTIVGLREARNVRGSVLGNLRGLGLVGVAGLARRRRR